jgi:diguanylate cyclase (GGDEF)-like protein/PAS domain S-box-containing protein
VVHVHGQVEFEEPDLPPKRVVGTILDVTQRVRFEAALRASEERYALAAQGANDGLWDWDLLSGKIYYSPRWEGMAGLPPGTLRQDPHDWYALVHPEDLDRLRTSLALHLAGDTPHFECEYRLRHAKDDYRWMLGRGLAVRDSKGRAYRVVGSQTDINAHKEALEQLAHNALFDGLTNLPNRALFLDRLDRAISRGRRRSDHSFAVLFLDIDRFKKINDSLGHSPGDSLLIEAARRFESCLRPGDTVARLGGDEFAILLDELFDQGQVMRVAERIQSELSRPFDLDGQEVFVTVSIGIALSRGGEERPEELLRNADTAMYRAKSQGRSRYEIFEVAMHQRAVHLLELETDLWRALERCEFRLFYQPIVDLGTGKVAGFEALIRWQHPDKGLVSPLDFIPLAEETGLIVPIGWWVLGEACRQMSAWQNVWPELPNPFVTVNLSSRQFSQADLADLVRGSLGGHELNPDCLKIEITESLLMSNTDSAAEALQQLKEIGVQLALDDFGTGYSSLSYLHRFPLDTLKIDRTFISGPQSGEKNVEIVSTILSLARGLSMTVVAEGVETREQLENLRALQCTFAQGFYFSRPLPPEGIEEFVAKDPAW